jgi:hypothetical protein
MIAQALIITSVIMLALFFYLLDACRFLIPYRDVLVQDYGRTIATLAGLLFVNLFAVIYQGCRIVGLKDTGRKLRHLEKQVRSGDVLGGDLGGRLGDQ